VPVLLGFLCVCPGQSGLARTNRKLVDAFNHFQATKAARARSNAPAGLLCGSGLVSHRCASCSRRTWSQLSGIPRLEARQWSCGSLADYVPGLEPLFSWPAAQNASMFEAYLLGCAVGLALSSLRFGLVFDLGMFTAWITERPDTPRVVSRGR
jgi:hypothetical protein